MYWEAWCRLLESKVNISPSLVLQILRSLYSQNIGNFEQRSILERESELQFFGFSFTNKDNIFQTFWPKLIVIVNYRMSSSVFFNKTLHTKCQKRSHFATAKKVCGPSLHCLLYRPNKALLWHWCLPVNLADTCNTLSVRIGNGREEL